MRASVSSDEIASARISCSDKSLKLFATDLSGYEPRTRILFLRHCGTGRNSRRRRDADRFSSSERIGWVDDDFIGWRDTLNDLDRCAEVAAHFDVAEFDRVIGFHNSNLQSLGAEQQGVVRQGYNLP